MESALRDLFFDACANTIKWGPGLLIALVMLYGLYKLIQGIGLKVVGALEKPTQALTSQAQSMDRLTGSIEKFMSIDRSEHREMIVLLKVIAGRMKHAEEGENARG